MSSALKLLMLTTDLGMLGYWSMTTLVALGLLSLPEAWLFADYHDPIVVAWNWSFLPLDLALSIAGLTSVRLQARHDDRWLRLAFVSLTMTSCAGLLAISFWAARGEFDFGWWSFNLFLMLWPAPFLLAGPALRPAAAAPK